MLEEDGSGVVEYSPPFPSRNRIKLTLTFIRETNEIKTVSLKRFKQFKARGWVEDDGPFEMTHFSFEKLASLLNLLKELDLANLNQSRIPIVEGVASGIDAAQAAKLKAILRQPDGEKIVEELVTNGLITSHDIVNLGYRKAQLAQFKRMLDDPARCVAMRKAMMSGTINRKRRGKSFSAGTIGFSATASIIAFSASFRMKRTLESRISPARRTDRGLPVG